MEKITAWLENGTNVLYLDDSFVETTVDSRIVINNVAIYWKFKNVHKDNYEVTLIESDGYQTVLPFGTGYWTFGMISERFKSDDVNLTKNRHNALRSLARFQKGHRDYEGNQNGQRGGRRKLRIWVGHHRLRHRQPNEEFQPRRKTKQNYRQVSDYDRATALQLRLVSQKRQL